MGMISNPKVLFLDEPTSGLDSTAAYFLVKYLVTLAQSTNVAVIMTIHQPAAIVFDMLQDLYLLETGRLAYFGPISAAESYFEDIGLACPKEFNPADYYLEKIYKPVPDALEAKGFKLWRDVFGASAIGKKMASKLGAANHGNVESSDDLPTFTSRFVVLLKFYLGYYWAAPGYYIYRAMYLLVSAIFIGTLFLNLEPDTTELTLYSGSIFFAIWTILFAAVGSTGLVASDRRQTYEQVKNGVVTPLIYCSAQFVSTIPYNFVCAVIFQSVFHWSTNINPSGGVFVYAIISTTVQLMLMESTMMIVVEIVKDAMLSVTLAMVVMGTYFLFAGFFVKTTDMPAAISWMSYVVPSKVSIFPQYIS